MEGNSMSGCACGSCCAGHKSMYPSLGRVVLWTVIFFAVFCAGYKIGMIKGYYMGGWMRHSNMMYMRGGMMMPEMEVRKYDARMDYGTVKDDAIRGTTDVKVMVPPVR